MRMCQPHWDALRAALDERGLSHLVAKDGKTALENLTSELEVGRTVENYDPLMAAHQAILSNVLLSPVGPSIFDNNDDGTERCPLCYLSEQHKVFCKDEHCKVENFDSWIDNAAEDQLAYWTGK